VDLKPAGKLACAGQSMAGRQFAAEDGENNLRRQLLAQAHFAGVVKPKAHGWDFSEKNTPCEGR
jgi:hypothetical protein